MRAKRSKKYRKIMSAYNMHFSFRTPYQVLCDSNFLRNCHAFHMPIRTFLENTLHGESHPYITQCTLASITRAHEKKFAKSKPDDIGQKGRGDGKPMWLPLPEEMPLRYCKHKDEEGKEKGIVSEEECLLDLLSGQVKGNEVPRNKQHYILATAEREEEQQKNRDGTMKRRRGVDIREKARVVPGVPIVYVKRSVMVLEEMTNSSERIIRGVEKEKFKEGLVGAIRGLKRKRDDESDSEDEAEEKQAAPTKTKGTKGPNPLSVKKKKSTNSVNNVQKRESETQEGDQPKKKTRRGKRTKKSAADKEDEKDSNAQDTTSAPAPASAA